MAALACAGFRPDSATRDGVAAALQQTTARAGWAIEMKWDPQKETCNEYVRNKMAALDSSSTQFKNFHDKIAAVRSGLPQQYAFHMPDHAKPQMHKLLEQASTIDTTYQAEQASLRRERQAASKRKDFQGAPGAAQLRGASSDPLPQSSSKNLDRPENLT